MSPAESTTTYGVRDQDLLDLDTVFRPDLFEGRVVLVSGAGSGIGKAIACLFGRLGARLVLCGRSEEKLATTVSLLEQIDAP